MADLTWLTALFKLQTQKLEKSIGCLCIHTPNPKIMKGERNERKGIIVQPSLQRECFLTLPHTHHSVMHPLAEVAQAVGALPQDTAGPVERLQICVLLQITGQGEDPRMKTLDTSPSLCQEINTLKIYNKSIQAI